MTTALLAPFRPGAFAGEPRHDHPLGRLRAAVLRRLRHRRTVGQLRGLSIRQREDIGIAGLDINAVARRAIHRN
jgi:uncharacterized protein YjiS (DUF1127 family)